MVRPSTRRELRLSQRLTITLAWLTIAASALFGVAFLVLAGEGTLGIPAEIAYILCTSLFSAGVVALLLDRIMLAEERLSLQSMIEDSIESSLGAMRELLAAAADVDLRWYCLVFAPSAGDPYPEYARQRLTIDKTVPELHDELRIVCCASMDDNCLAAYTGDPRYILRWMVDDGLDLADDRVFRVLRVSVDGSELAVAADETVTTPYGPVREFRYRRPTNSQRHAPRLSLTVETRKYVGSERHLVVRTQTFNTVFGADYRCTVSESYAVRRGWVTLSEITGLGSPVVTGPPLPEVSGSRKSDPPSEPSSLRVVIDTPVQIGSALTFTFERSAQS